jgi:hypothetical protein
MDPWVRARVVGEREAVWVRFVDLYLNRRMQLFTALKSWTGDVLTVFNSWTELYLNRRRHRSFGREFSLGGDHRQHASRSAETRIAGGNFGHEINGHFRPRN